MAGPKSTQRRFVRDKHLLYIPTLAFLDYCAPIIMLTCLSSVACGRHSLGVVPWLSQWSVRIVSFDSIADDWWMIILICTPQKASVGMYSRCLSLTNLVCVLFDPAIPTSSFNFIVTMFFYTCNDTNDEFLPHTSKIQIKDSTNRPSTYRCMIIEKSKRRDV